MVLRSLMMTLLASTAFTNAALSQTAQQIPAPGTTNGQQSAPATVVTPAPAVANTTPTPAAPAAKAAPSAPAAKAAQAPAPRPAAPASVPAPASSAADFGTVSATAPARSPTVQLTQPGLTASPTDYAAAANRAAQAPQGSATSGPVGSATQPTSGTAPQGATVGGVNRQDYGGGYMIPEVAAKTRSTVTRDAIDKQSPTANPYQLIELLPGVIQASSDNTGLNGGNIRLRGFNSDKVGLTIEGAPVNDSGNYALYPQEYVDAENICQVSVAQGSPDLDSPHVGAVGGVINMYMCDPSKKAGGVVSASVGSNNLYRGFIRGETGQVGNMRAYISFSNLQKDHWAGSGSDERRHIDFKAVMDLSPGNTIRFSAIYNDALNNFYANPTLAQFNTNNYKPSFLNTLPSTFFRTTSPIDQSANNAGNFYNYRMNPFQNLILSAPSNFTLSPNLKFDTVPYFWYGFGNGGGTAAMNDGGMFWGNTRITGVNYGGTGALTDRTLYYNPSVTETYRPGVINKLTYNTGNHEIVAGHWFEYAYHRQTAPYEQLNSIGQVNDYYATDANFRLPSGATCTIATGPQAGRSVACPTGAMQRRDQLTETMTNMIFLGDTWKVNNQLSLIYGAKYVMLDRNVQNYLPNALNPKTNYTENQFLPTVGLRYKIDNEHMVFANYAESFRSAPNFTMAESYSNTSGARTPILVPEPEHGRSIEVGHRYQGQNFATSVSAFYGWFDNFQQFTTILDTATGVTTPIGVTIPIGGLVHYGINAEIGFKPVANWRPYLSGELLRTEMQDNLQASGTRNGVTVSDYLPTKGKELPGAPRYSMGAGLDYDDGKILGNVAYKHVGAQYATFMNDEQMESYGRVNAMIGYRFSNVGFLKSPELKLNLFNVLSLRQLVGVNGITNNARSTTGVNGSTIGSSSPTYYMGQEASGIITFRAGF